MVVMWKLSDFNIYTSHFHVFVNETKKMNNITINSGVSTIHNKTMFRSAEITVLSCAAHLIRVSASNYCGESPATSTYSSSVQLNSSSFNSTDTQNTSQQTICQYNNANKNTCKYQGLYLRLNYLYIIIILFLHLQ